ncbi:MAG: arginine decarboxylase [Cytophagales bacterium]|nr:arginine decarboxylase [Cytophagales bacterium]
MKNKYKDLIDQTFDFPQDEFKVENNALHFHDIPLMDIVRQYGTPLRLSFLPKISENISKAQQHFRDAFRQHNYQGSYNYCYCTKSSHFAFVMREALKNDIHLETSSAFDIDLIEKLHKEDKITKQHYIVANGCKMPDYVQKLAGLIHNGFENAIPIFDNYMEPEQFDETLKKPCKVGIRIASEEEPKFTFYTSRLGIGYQDIVPFYKEKIENNPKFELRMLHFFINTGISDTAYYWNELRKSVKVYCELKKLCPELDSLNIGGGFPIKNSLNFEFDYSYMINEIVQQIKLMCNTEGVTEPNIFTEFGSYTVGESGATLFTVHSQKRQNDRERWDMIDGSFMTALPDSWAINQKFIFLAVNHWDKEYERVLLGGLTCDSDDFYNSEQHTNAIFLPQAQQEERLVVGFFNTGAYQDSLGGVGGIHHCLIPNPKHVIIEKDKEGKLQSRLFRNEQQAEEMLNILGY